MTPLLDFLPNMRQLDGHKELHRGEERMRNDRASAEAIAGAESKPYLATQVLRPQFLALSFFQILGVRPVLQSLE